MSATATKHHPTITTSSSRYWVRCACGWTSGSWANVTEAHLSFGRHLVHRGNKETS